ncbi:MAG TPA: S41 family peptidase [Pyrinomonadaceae bacterium]|jgi:carboxyl-terminal processing protease|nr:S41 family peptidase [Pyrinomonadaceae bacterium]
MSKKFAVTAAALILVAAIFGGTIGSGRKFSGFTSSNTKNSYRVGDEIEKDYNEAVSTITSNYSGDIDYERATQAAIQGMLSTLDPHSAYFPYSEFKKLKEDQDSRFYGIGVTIVQHRDGVYVQSTMEGTPAAKLGLKYGDRIIEVDGKNAREWSSEQVSKNVRGGLGEPVTIKVERAGSEAPLYFTIVRDAVPLPTIRNSYMIRSGTGYIGLTGGFQRSSDEELAKAMKRLSEQGMRQLILDLRGNPGGLLDQAIDVASEFLPRGKVVVSVKGRTEYSEPIVYKSTGSDPATVPLVVLINRNSASASEIVAGAIQDHGRGLIVGETSFGKGLVQRIFQLPFNTGLTLTTARYYTPYGRSLQRDYSSGSLYDYYTRHEPTENQTTPVTSGPHNIETPLPVASPTPHLHTGPPVQTAAGRVFYGGGGITPDIEVKETANTPTRGRIAEAAFQFTRQLVAGIVPGLESYRVDKVQYGKNAKATDFPITDRVLEAFRNYLRSQPDFQVQPAQVDEELEFAKLRLRQEIVTAAFSNDAGARILLDSDPQVLRALDALPDAKRLADTTHSTVFQG